MTTDDELESETEARSKNTPAITAYVHRCRKRQQTENLWDYNFKARLSHFCWIVAKGNNY